MAAVTKHSLVARKAIDPHLCAVSLTLIIADDHKIVRDGLRVLFERAPGHTVLGEAADGHTAVKLALQHRPKIVIMDMAMPNLNGIEASRHLRAAGFTGGIVMLSMHSERRVITQALAAGVSGYVLKDYAFEQLQNAVQAVARGDSYLSPQLAAMKEEGSIPLITDLLTSREREVLQMLAEGHGAKEIGFRLGVSSKTIDTHRLNLMAKLKSHSVAELIRIAIKEGLSTP